MLSEVGIQLSRLVLSRQTPPFRSLTIDNYSCAPHLNVTPSETLHSCTWEEVFGTPNHVMGPLLEELFIQPITDLVLPPDILNRFCSFECLTHLSIGTAVTHFVPPVARVCLHNVLVLTHALSNLRILDVLWTFPWQVDPAHKPT